MLCLKKESPAFQFYASTRATIRGHLGEQLAYDINLPQGTTARCTRGRKSPGRAAWRRDPETRERGPATVCAKQRCVLGRHHRYFASIVAPALSDLLHDVSARECDGRCGRCPTHR